MNQKILSPLFALLIFVAHLNCVLEHGLSCDGSPTTTIGQPALDLPFGSPIPGDSNECDHGCICQGATLADHYVFSSFELPAFGFDYLAVDSLTLSIVDRAEGASSQQQRALFTCLPLRASDRCAMLQTFLI